MAIEEFNGGGLEGFIPIPEGKKKWGWYGSVKVLQFLLFSFIPWTVVLPVPILWQHPRNAPLLNW
jgi:hypothetical protein